ncbi:BCAM0308 family protein [Propionivibrio sp.]|uniref:BCAM0308 family protein n=1 Tax=Propionivibrio sp. TaxID=2212460 RepID=UPI003BF06E67
MNLDSSSAELQRRFKSVRRNQLIEDSEHDSYRLQQKPAEPSVCPDCGAIFHAGRWQWGNRQPESAEVVCPACLRIRDQFPAGYLHIRGAFFSAHRGEILSLLQHHAERVREEHALARIINIKDEDEGREDGILVTTTDIHLARTLGEALHHAYKGDLDFHYNEAETLLRIHWRR